MGEPGALLLKIRRPGGPSYEFLLEDDRIGEKYVNEISVQADGPITTHPKDIIWVKGKFEDLTINLHLTVGIGIIKSPEMLIEVTENIMKLAIAGRTGNSPNDRDLKDIEISVGSFMVRTGKIRDVGYEFANLLSNGLPTQSFITLTIVQTKPGFRQPDPSDKLFTVGNGEWTP